MFTVSELPEPRNETDIHPHEVERVEGITDDLRDDPGQEEERESSTRLSRRKGVDDGPGDKHAGEHLKSGDKRVGLDQAKHGVEDLKEGGGLEDLEHGAYVLVQRPLVLALDQGGLEMGIE